MIIRARPEFSNSRGDMFGGWMMAQMDIAASIPAVKRAEGSVTTAAVKELSLLKPVLIGDLLKFYAVIQKSGVSSMTIQVDVYREDILGQRATEKVAEGCFIFVAISNLGKPRRLPKEPAAC